VVLNVGTAVGIALHVTMMSVFAALGAVDLVRFNVVSIAAFVLAMLFNRRGWHLASVVTSVLELTVHQALCVTYLGWAFGFQYYLLVIPSITNFLPEGRNAIKALLVLLSGLAYVALAHVSQTVSPVFALPLATSQSIHDVNVVAVVGTLGLFAFFFNRAANLAEGRLEVEHQKVEDLLHSILPVSIARRLQDSPRVIADAFPAATVLFADIVGFTSLSLQTNPADLVATLNEIFTRLDRLADQHGLEKIKTIGDAYMVAAGVPEAMPKHAEAMADFALGAMAEIEKVAPLQSTSIQLRIGVHSGPVVAGVIGKKKFIYDLWGETVNRASRMESHGVPGEIQVSDATKRLLDEDFVFEDRGMLEIKGIGETRAWILKRRK
jgi:adenylate cyclase